MKRFFRISTIALSLLGASLATTAAFAQPEQPQQQQQQQGHAHQRHHRGGGIYGQALKLGSLRDDQRQAIEQIKVAMKGPRQAAKTARGEYAAVLAAQIQSGGVNPAILQLKASQVVTTAMAESVAAKAGLAKLHDVLDKSQREELANGIEARMDRHGQGAQGRPHAGGQGKRHGGAGKLAKELSLSDAQKEQVKDILKEEHQAHKNPQGRANAKAQHKAMLESFKQDSFTPSMDASAAGTRAKERVMVYTETVQKIVPILTAEQKVTFAEKMKAHAQHGNMGL